MAKKTVRKKPDIHLRRLHVGQLQHQLAARRVEFESLKKSITLKDLYGRFIAALGRDNVDLNWALSKIIRGGSGAVWDVALKLMRSRQFNPDGLLLQKADVLACKTVGDLLKLILKWYESNGWVVD